MTHDAPAPPSAIITGYTKWAGLATHPTTNFALLPRRSRVISITFTSKDPHSAAILANTVAQHYLAEDRARTGRLATTP